VEPGREGGGRGDFVKGGSRGKEISFLLSIFSAIGGEGGEARASRDWEEKKEKNDLEKKGWAVHPLGAVKGKRRGEISYFGEWGEQDQKKSVVLLGTNWDHFKRGGRVQKGEAPFLAPFPFV